MEFAQRKRCPGCGKLFQTGVSKCDNCGRQLITESSTPSAAQSGSAFCANSSGHWESAQDLVITLGLSSGRSYTVSDIRLYDRSFVESIGMRRAQAQRDIGGFKTGLWSFGNLGSVVTRSLLLGAFEESTSKGMQNHATVTLAEANQLYLQYPQKALYFSPRLIKNAELPNPALWCATLKHPNGNTDFIHNGDPFVRVRTAEGQELLVIWDKLETYEAVARESSSSA